KHSSNVPIEADVDEFVCQHCGTKSPVIGDYETLGKVAKDPLIGQSIADWEVVQKVGEGGFGMVYKAIDKNLQRPVAIKVMLQSLSSNLEFVQKFYREAITAAALNHPNIVGIHRVGRDEQRNLNFLVMEFLEGRTLADCLEERGPFSLDEAVPIILQCADALAAAHDKNIVHRDIKPENIMMDSRGVVKITDFGLAKTLSSDQKSTKVMGTPHFMSPEQFEGKSVDGRTDIYSLGVTFYFLLTKAKPYKGENTVQIIYSILTQEPQPVTELAPEVPEEIWRIIRKMIART
ncbi:MAG: serine/threonine protein kinase, partial [Planctomycetes bacterium]|nr:serine/threonine protein kinase [Planctomycetota bacterium]